MSTQMVEAAFEAEDDRTPREQEIAAFQAAVKHLDPEEVLFSACAVLPFQQSSALMDLIQEQISCPFEDISRAHIHPDKAQRIARAFLEAVAVSLEGMSSLRIAVES